MKYSDFLSKFKSRVKESLWIRSIVGGLIVLIILSALTMSAPEQFPVNDMVVIPEGVSLEAVSEILKTRKIIRSKTLFIISAEIFGDGKVIAGGYLFDRKESLTSVARRLVLGDHKLKRIRITFPEGINVAEAASICSEFLKTCNKEEFVEIAKNLEGYLFPDTYFFLESATAKDVITMMNETSKQKLASLDKEIRLFGKSLDSVVIMASILEKEAREYEDMQMVSSILWKRMDLNMPLQVDATLDYALDKNTYELTLSDLATTSPYNTYKFKGLPPAPIANPGINSLRAAISPTPTKYLYYLTDLSGKFYYAETHDKHLVNKRRYMMSES